MKHEIINNGKPNLKNMTKAEFNVFCKSVLDIIIEDKKDKEKSPAEENGDSYIKTHILSWTNWPMLLHIVYLKCRIFIFL